MAEVECAEGEGEDGDRTQRLSLGASAKLKKNVEMVVLKVS